METITIHKTKAGNAALCESGGGSTNTGKATIICGRNGEKLCPIWTGSHANGTHAIFPVHSDREYHLITARRWTKQGGVYEIKVYRLSNRHRWHDNDGKETWRMDATLITSRLDGEWTSPLPEYLEAAVQAAEKKSTCYHCRCMHYGKGKEV